MDRVSFLVNGEPRSVGSETSSEVSLLDYLRIDNDLRGTKYMCREGGCGACIVTAERPGQPPHAVNSCLVSVTSCQNWNITTIEGVGNRLKGYHPVQKTLAKLNGTQCGYCSPGWVMSMYRNCIGIQFAKMQHRLFMAKLLHRFRLAAMEHRRRDLKVNPFRVIIFPMGGIKVKILPREKHINV